jgi:hypothetical protein
MAESRYIISRKLLDNTAIGSASTYKIRRAVISGEIPYNTILLEQGQRLDHIAGAIYGSSELWWIIAAASGIGWGMQCPPGTVINIPNNPSDAFGVL